MRYGVTMFVTDRSMSATALARAAEERGFDSLYLPEHTHIPTSRKTPYPLGDTLPDEYKRTIDPFVGLAAAAAVTTKLRLGTGICLVAQRDPIITAKEVASLDMTSGGRFVFGIGVGWNEDEAVDHGIDFAKRRSIVRDRVLLMQRLWADDVAEYEGTYAKLPPSWAWPKPVQKPRPPVYYGASRSRSSSITSPSIATDGFRSAEAASKRTWNFSAPRSKSAGAIRRRRRSSSSA